MANFPCNPMLFIPAGLHLEQAWQRPARSRVALGGEPPRRHEQYAIITLEPPPMAEQIPDIIEDVAETLEHDFPVRVVSSFPSPLGLGLFQLESPVQRQALLDASPIQFGHGWLTVQKHDEARNFRSCNYIRQCWIMFLAFPLDYQTMDFIKAAIAPFGRLIHWIDGPNKSRVLTQCLVLSPDRVPRSVVISQGTVLGGNGCSWSVPVYILGGHFPDAFPQDEDPVPADGNPHPMHGNVNQGNPNIFHNWQHDMAGAAQAVHEDAGVNNEQMQEVQHEIGNSVQVDEGWPEWEPMHQDDDVLAWDNPEDDVQQESLSFDQSGSTAEYLRANGPDITLTIEDVLKGRMVDSSSLSSSSSDEATSAATAVPRRSSLSFRISEESAFTRLVMPDIPRPLSLPICIQQVSLNRSQETNHHEESPLAIIPYQPSLHAVLIQIWANSMSQEDSNGMSGSALMRQKSSVSQDPSLRADDAQADNTAVQHQEINPIVQVEASQDQRVLGLPSVVSMDTVVTPLVTSSVRRSSRLSELRDGFKQAKHIQLEENPRKKRRVWREVPISPKEAALLLEKPPLPTDDEILGEIPTEILKGWGLDCNVAPEELTVEALNKADRNDDEAN
ncbi:unnamed protein product [Urochloa humidicola]